MKQIAKVLIAFCLLFALPGCSKIAQIGESLNKTRASVLDKVATTDLQQEIVSDLKLGQSIKDQSFTSQYGEQLTKRAETDLYTYYTLNPNVDIATNKGEDTIIRILLQNDNTGTMHTQKGTKIGSSKGDVISSYGNNYYERTEQGANIIGYVDQTLHQTLEFWLYEGKVHTIRFDISSME